MMDDVKRICDAWIAKGMGDECFWENWAGCPTPDDTLTPAMVSDLIAENAALAEQVKRALDVLAEADRRIVWEGMGFGNDFADKVEDVIRALRGATEGAGEP